MTGLQRLEPFASGVGTHGQHPQADLPVCNESNYERRPREWHRGPKSPLQYGGPSTTRLSRHGGR